MIWYLLLTLAWQPPRHADFPVCVRLNPNGPVVHPRRALNGARRTLSETV